MVVMKWAYGILGRETAVRRWRQVRQLAHWYGEGRHARGTINGNVLILPVPDDYQARHRL